MAACELVGEDDVIGGQLGAVVERGLDQGARDGQAVGGDVAGLGRQVRDRREASRRTGRVALYRSCTGRSGRPPGGRNPGTAVFDIEKKDPGAIRGMRSPTVIGSAAAGDAATLGAFVGTDVDVGDGEGVGVASQPAMAIAAIKVNARAMRTLRLPSDRPPRVACITASGRAIN